MTKPNDSFDLEQDIIACWSIIEDIKLLNIEVQDGEVPMTVDQIANFLLGLETIYGYKFNKLFRTLCNLVKEGTLK